MPRKAIAGAYIVDALQSSSDGLQVLEMPLPTKQLVLQKDQFSSTTNNGTNSNVAPPSQPVQVKILKTVDNLPDSSHNKLLLKKPFKPPALLLVALEAAGLGMLWFTGDYLGKVAYNNYRSKVVVGSTIPFDRLEAEYQAVQNVMATFSHRNNKAFPGQVEGNWMSHANNLLKLSTQYLQSPGLFYGHSITMLTEGQIKEKITEYLNTALAFYKRNGHQQHQVQIANLMVTHQLAMPDNTYDKVVEAFLGSAVTPRQLWQPETLKHHKQLVSGCQDVAHHQVIDSKSWRKILVEQLEIDVRNFPKHKEHYTKLLAQLVNLEAGLKIVQQSSKGGELPDIKPLQTMLLEYHHLLLLPPIDNLQKLDENVRPDGPPKRIERISIILLLEKVHLLASQCSRLNEAYVLETTINGLLEDLIKGKKYDDLSHILAKFIDSDMQLKDSSIKKVSPTSLLNQWALGQLHGLKHGDLHEVIRIEELIHRLDAVKQNKEEAKTLIKQFYQTVIKPEDSSAGLFTFRLFAPIVKRYYDEVPIEISEGVYADSRYRYDLRRQMLDQLKPIFS